jgi:hypothetical protein
MSNIIQFKAPCTMMVAGATNSGKTRWVYRLLRNVSEMFTLPTQHILYCYGIYQSPLFDEMKREIPGIMFHQGLPDKEDLLGLSGGHQSQGQGHSILILDDLVQSVVNSKETEEMFTQHCHHMCVSVIFITQNLLTQGRNSRTINLNMHVFILLKNLRNASQIKHFAGQIFPGKTKTFQEIIEDVMKEPYSYLVVDLSPASQDEYRLRTRVFPDDDEHMIVYKFKIRWIAKRWVQYAVRHPRGNMQG